MGKIKIDNNVFIPMPMAIVGTMHDGKPNFMAAGWNTRANAAPPMVAIGIGRSHQTHVSLREKGSFSLNLPGENLLVKTDYVGIATGAKTDKSGVFEVFYGENKEAPLIKEAPISLECRVVEMLELPTNTLFIGEITGAWCDEEFLTAAGKPDFRKAGCYFLTMPDNAYWGFGKELGKAWSAGKGYKG